MNSGSKLTLSDEELQLVMDREWILTKRIIMEKIYRLFGALADDMKAVMEKERHWLPAEVFASSPKISKGENYLQLPYVMLDYPRCFGGEHVFAVRTLFWWGNFFSITLQLSGRYKAIFAERIYGNKEMLLGNDHYLCVNDDPWQHHFEKTNYLPVAQLGEKELEQLILRKPFLKCAMKFPLQQWPAVHVLLERSFADMLKLLKV